jgi:rubrerythrin
VAIGYAWTFADIFRTAVRLEQDGLAFYRRARELNLNPGVVRVFAELAADEEKHARDLEETYFERATVFGSGEPPLERLASIKTDAEALALAISMEEDAVRFYQGLVPFAEREEARAALEELIAQEGKHASLLRSELARAGGG